MGEPRRFETGMAAMNNATGFRAILVPETSATGRR
jgi:hypothetical protein